MASEKDQADGSAANGPQQNPQQEDQHNGVAQATEKPQKQDTSSSKKKGPAGGFDKTPIPQAPPGYTIKITFHRATNLPPADIHSLSADPFIMAQIYTDLPTRHKEDPPLQLRTKTVHQNIDPVWNTQWILANIPAQGFKLKCRIYDEDSTDHDDRLGNVTIVVGQIDENWAGIKNTSYQVKKRMGSKRAYFIRGVTVCFKKVDHMGGNLFISIEMLGKTEGDHGGRVYTVGPQYFIRHYSPLLGRLLGQKEPREEDTGDSNGKNKQPQRYNFQANQMQLHGPVPEAMYHRYVEFKAFVKSMFTAKGIRGFLLSKALHHQHARVYNFDAKTEYEYFEKPSKDFTLKFLDLVHYDQGGRIFTYVLTLDALFRFTETGKEFGIDMLSKHTMHSDVSVYVAFSGEFFIRRHKHRGSSDDSDKSPSHPPDEISGGPPHEEPKKDPSYYELVIDNDSGTYRPNAELLPQLKSFLEANLPGLRITTLDCQADAEKMGKMKEEQRERKKKEGQQIVYMQASRSSSLSSSDIEELDRLEQGGEHQESHFRHQMLREVNARADAAKVHAKEYHPRVAKEGWKGLKKDGGQSLGGQGHSETEPIDAGGSTQEKLDGGEEAGSSKPINASTAPP